MEVIMFYITKVNNNNNNNNKNNKCECC